MKHIETEIIATNIKDVEVINNSKANRIELIENIELGGLTPTQELIALTSEIANTPFNVMLRPHANSFIYNQNDEFIILKQLDYIRDHSKASGIVFGSLTDKNLINLKQLELIIKHKGNLTLTFHRAIDESIDVVSSYRELINYSDINLVLTSGSKNTAIQGISNIIKMLEIEPSQYCKVLCGAGINQNNIIDFVKQSKATRIHIGSAVRNNGLVDKNLLNNMLLMLYDHIYV